MNRAPLLVAATVGASLLATDHATAQHQRMMVMDDGSGPAVMHVSMPDMGALRTPDYLREDLPVFDTELRLDETQRTLLRALHDDYLAAFALLQTEMLPAPPKHGPIVMHGTPHEGHIGHDEAHGDEILGGFMVMIEAGAGAAGGGGGGGGGGGTEDITVDIAVGEDGTPEASVAIAVQGPDGAEIPEEVRKQLEEHAKKMAEQIQERMERAQEEGGDPLDGMSMMDRMEERRRYYEDVAAAAESFKEEKEDLRNRFVVDVQTQLEDPQLDRWPRLERTLTRHKTLPNGRLDGERTDLVEVLGAIEPAQTLELAEQVEAYETMMHDALTRRNAYVDDANDRVSEALKSGEPDKALSYVDRATQLRLAVRDLNRNFAASIAEELDALTAQTFKDEYLRVSYPRVYRETPGLKVFAAARRLDGVGEDALLGILELESAYRAELEAVNAAIRQAIDTHQPDETRRAIAHMADIIDGAAVEFGGDDDKDPVKTAFDRRNAIEDRYVSTLHDMLEPEQVAALPAMPSREPQTFFFETIGGSEAN
jgi:hypothetical protein